MNIIAGAASMAALLLGAGHASAQTAGTYTGTSADGESLSLTVSLDGNSQLAVTGASISINATCPKNVPAFGTGTGYGQDAVIKGNGKFGYTEQYVYLNEVVAGTFDGDNLTGTIYSAVPSINFTSGSKYPKTAVVCTSALQTFTATLQTPDATRKQQPSKLTVYSAHK